MHPRALAAGNLALAFPGGSDGKESACNAGDLGLIPGSGRPPGYPLHCSGLENSMDCIVHGVTMSQTQLSYFHSLGMFIQSCLCLPVAFP